MGLLLENGYEGQNPDPEKAKDLYLEGHNLGNTDATNNLAYYYLNNRYSQVDLVMAKALLKCAYIRGDNRAADHMLQFGLISSKNELT